MLNRRTFRLAGHGPAVLALVFSSALAQTKRVPDVPYVPTPSEVVDAMLELAKVGPSDVVYDLGSGDGRIVIAAAKLGARGVGVDINSALIEQARANARKAGVEDKVRFIEEDLFDTDLKPATVVTLYLLPSINLKLKPKLRSELRPGARVVSKSFDMGDWSPDKTAIAFTARLYLWIIPEKR